MGFREAWYRPGRPLLLIVRMAAYLAVSGYFLFVSTVLPAGDIWLPLYRAGGWMLVFTALGIHMRRVSARDELDFLAVLPISRSTQLLMWLAEGLVRHLGFSLAVAFLFIHPVLLAPRSAGLWVTTYLLLWLHANLLAVTVRLVLEHLERFRWLYLVMLLPIGALAVYLGRALGSGTSLVEALAPLSPLDRWVGFYWYAAAAAAHSWTSAGRSLLVGLAELAGLLLAALLLMSNLHEAPATTSRGRRSPIPAQVRHNSIRLSVQPPGTLATLLRHNLRLFFRGRSRTVVTVLLPFGVVGLIAVVGDSLLALAREGDPQIRALVTVLFSTATALTATTSTVGSALRDDHGILGFLRASAGPLTYLIGKLVCAASVSVVPALASSGLATYLIRGDWPLACAVTAASVVIMPALSLLLQVVRLAFGGDPAAPSTSSSVWLGLGAYAYVVTLVLFALTGHEALILWLAIPLWLKLSGAGLVAAGRLLAWMDLAE